jgi:hypothetical protein
MTHETADDMSDLGLGLEDDEPLFAFDTNTEDDFTLDEEPPTPSDEGVLVELEIRVNYDQGSSPEQNNQPRHGIEHDLNIDDEFDEHEVLDDYGNPVSDQGDEEFDWSSDSYDREVDDFDREADMVDIFRGNED